METLEHTFPIPEIETHKLDVIREQLPKSAKTYASDHAWMLVAVSGLAGGVLGLLWPRKSHDRD